MSGQVRGELSRWERQEEIVEMGRIKVLLKLRYVRESLNRLCELALSLQWIKGFSEVSHTKREWQFHFWFDTDHPSDDFSLSHINKEINQ